MNLFEQKFENSNSLHFLFWYRCFSIIGQILASLVAKFVFFSPFNGLGVAVIIGMLILFNSFTWFQSRSKNEINDFEVFTQLLVDIIALSVLFYFSGGATNPFVSMYFLPLAIGAVLLNQLWVWSLAIISTLAYSILIFLIPWQHIHDVNQFFNLHVFGMWVSFVIGAIVIAFFVMKMRDALRKKDRLLNDAREQAIRDEKLISLGALAASTAHELGNPLGTIQLLVSDLEKNKISKKEIDLLQEQVNRCKQALSEISAAAGGTPLEGGEQVKAREYLQNILSVWKNDKAFVNTKVSMKGESTVKIIADKALGKAIINILDNAADASPDVVEITAECNNEQVRILVADNGRSIDKEVLQNIGKKVFSDKQNGIGIGAFLAHEIIRRLGGTVELSNRASGGVLTAITLPAYR